MFQTGTITGAGTITVTRIAPDGSSIDFGDVQVIVSQGPDGSSISVVPSTAQPFINGETVNESFTISNLQLSDDISIVVYEG
jgi:hypothetical protein